MTARDLLHRLVDDLDEDDAELLASVAAASPTDQTHMGHDADVTESESTPLLTLIQAETIQDAVDSGIWPEQTQNALRKWLSSLAEGPRRFVVLTLVVARPPDELRRQIVSALASWRGASGDAETARASREQIVADALGSVRAEGLEPSAAALRESAEYEAGRMTADDLYQSALRRARSTTGR